MVNILNTKKPYGAITGKLEGVPDAKFVQDHKYYDRRGRYLCDTDGTGLGGAIAKEEANLPHPGAHLDEVLLMPGTKVGPYLTDLTDEEVTELLVKAREQGKSAPFIAAVELEESERAEIRDAIEGE